MDPGDVLGVLLPDARGDARPPVATLRAVALVAQPGHQPDPGAGDPLRVLVALGVDYNIFLVSRIREETARLGHRDGVLRGLAVTGGVISSAGLVLAATFGSLGALPMVAFVEMGVLVALGVLIDTFLIRSIMVPALALDLGRLFWWPGRLAGRAIAAESAGNL